MFPRVFKIFYLKSIACTLWEHWEHWEHAKIQVRREEEEKMCENAHFWKSSHDVLFFCVPNVPKQKKRINY